VSKILQALHSLSAQGRKMPDHASSDRGRGAVVNDGGREQERRTCGVTSSHNAKKRGCYPGERRGRVGALLRLAKLRGPRGGEERRKTVTM